MTESRAGRPKASSREILAEAACELFLERGYESTSVSDITTRAGVSRSSFFNYFSSKSDILWSSFDERMRVAVTALESTRADPRAVLAAMGEDLAPDTLALAIAQSAVMGIESELARERAVRQLRLGGAVAHRLVRSGADPLSAHVQGAAFAGAVIAAIWQWAGEGAGHTALEPLLRRALQVAARIGEA